MAAPRLSSRALGPGGGCFRARLPTINFMASTSTPRPIARVAVAAQGAAPLRGKPVASGLWVASAPTAPPPRRPRRSRRAGLGWDDIVLTGGRAHAAREMSPRSGTAPLSTRTGISRAGCRASRHHRAFRGPSGTGKTMAAEVLAGDGVRPLPHRPRRPRRQVHRRDREEPSADLPAAEESGAILFFDEADALFGKRTEVRDSHDRYANIEVNYLLQRMEEYTGLAILATDRRSVLDRAFLRRLRFLVDFPLPAADSRLRIWQKVLPRPRR